jgi:hypothetical protein
MQRMRREADRYETGLAYEMIEFAKDSQKKPRTSSARRRDEFCARGRTVRAITLGKRANERRDNRHTTNKGGPKARPKIVLSSVRRSG